ncbi:NAD(P)/FAD-dependent oxidoreductase, partial [Salinispira pacifica]
MRDLVIMGAGPAGLSAAAYAIRKRLDLLVISPDLGGKTNYHFTLPWMDDFQVIRANETVASFKRELDYIGFSHRRDTVKAVELAGSGFVVHTTSGQTEESHALIIATGASQVPLDVPGERKFLSRGLGYSAVSYSHLFIDRTVFLTGNGPRVLRAAFDAALHAAQVVTVLEPVGEYDPSVLAALRKRKNVTLVEGGSIVEFRGREFAEEVVVRDRDSDLRTYRADGFFVERQPVPASLPVAELL